MSGSPSTTYTEFDKCYIELKYLMSLNKVIYVASTNMGKKRFNLYAATIVDKRPQLVNINGLVSTMLGIDHDEFGVSFPGTPMANEEFIVCRVSDALYGESLNGVSKIKSKKL